MATALRVQCINKTNRSFARGRISHIGGTNSDGTHWRLTEPDAIQSIKGNMWWFYVECPAGHRVKVIVASRSGREYLKTAADGERSDNLLSLPERPA